MTIKELKAIIAGMDDSKEVIVFNETLLTVDSVEDASDNEGHLQLNLEPVEYDVENLKDRLYRMGKYMGEKMHVSEGALWNEASWHAGSIPIDIVRKIVMEAESLISSIRIDYIIMDEPKPTWNDYFDMRVLEVRKEQS